MPRFGSAPAAAAPRLLLLALAAAAALLSAAAAAPTTGRELPGVPGYTFASNVESYLSVSKDVCEIKSALAKSPPDYATARDIYSKGKNSRRSDGTLRTLRQFAIGSYPTEPFWSTYSNYFGDPVFLDTFISFALNGEAPFTTDAQRRQAAVKGIESGLMVAYVKHELDAAADSIKKGEIAEETGAPHAVDEAFALYVGGSPDCSPFGVSNRLAADFGTLKACGLSAANAATVQGFADALDAAKSGDAQAFPKAQAIIQQKIATTYTQATLKYAEQVTSDLAADQPTDGHQAEGYAYFRTIEPLVAGVNASSAATIKKLLFPGNPVFNGTNTQVPTALRIVAPGLGIGTSDIGSLGAKQPNLTCAAAPAPASSSAATTTSAAAVVLATLAAGAVAVVFA